MKPFEEIFNISNLEDTIDLCDDYIKDLSRLGERIVIGDNGNTRTEIDKNLVSIFKDVKSTAEMTRKLYDEVDKNRRKVVNSTFEKYFRLIAENSKKLINFTKRIFTDKRVILKLSVNIIEKGKIIIDKFAKGINSVFSNINKNNHTNIVSLLEVPRWLSKQEIIDWKIEWNRRLAQGYPMIYSAH